MPGVNRISFDRAVDYYDATRGLPADVSDRVAATLASELSGATSCVEVGVGTGRIAMPLHRTGVPLIGIDVAEAMLRRLIDNAGGQLPFPLLIADATRLPLRDNSVDAVLFSHVLHLITDWPAAVAESMRIAGPHGRLLVDFGGGTRAPWYDDTRAILREHGIVQIRPGVSAPEPVLEQLGDGATMRALPGIELSFPRSLSDDLRDWEQQLFSWTWRYSPEQMRAGCDDVRQWARTASVDIDAPAELRYVVQWWVFSRS